MKDYSQIISGLFESQFQEWELARINYRQLGNVKNREIDFGAFSVFVQYNPGRVRSSSASVDAKSIEARPCFLCEKNRPAEQRGVSFDRKLTILINPFPIFKRHLTIPSELHIDQRIRNNFDTMLLLAEALPSYIIFYNGPQCGASAPDHFHFQAGNRGFMPIEKDFHRRDLTALLSSNEGMEIWQWKGYQRGIFTLRGDNSKKLVNTFNDFLEGFAGLQPGLTEPMLNILVDHADNIWTIHIIPRKKHRPSQFFAEEKNRLMISPAAVDLGGVMITPREEDFEMISRADMEDIFAQVCFNENEITDLIKDIV
jgi:hypothetical protein